MKIKVRGISVYFDILNGIKELDVESGVTIKELLSRILPRNAEADYGLIVFVNGIASNLEYKLREGDLLEIAPNFSGG